MKDWYLIHTKPRKETVAEQNLQRQGYEVYLPLIQQPRRRRGQWVEVIEPLFSRYLFVHLQSGQDDFSPIKYTIGVYKLVRFTEQPAVVPDQVIELLRQTADRSTGLHRPHAPLFQPGDTVLIEKGPLAGLHAIFWAETAQERAIILLEILGRENRIVVERDALNLACKMLKK